MKEKILSFRYFVVAVGLLLSSSNAWCFNIDHAADIKSVEIVATGLKKPFGMAIDPIHRELYVAEMAADQISIIKNKKAFNVFGSQFVISDSIPSWAVDADHSMEHWTDPKIIKPSGIAFDSHGRLYVAEARENGRLLCFEPAADGLIAATIIHPPMNNPSYGFTSICMDQNGQLYLTAQNMKSDATLGFGSVMKRGKDGAWRLVDYSPFAKFCNVSIDPQGKILLVAETQNADATWYSTEHELEMRSMDGLNGLRCLTLLKDGTALGAVQRKNGKWSLVEIDPVGSTIKEWISELSEIGGLCIQPETGEIYVSLFQEGKILKLQRSGKQSMDDVDTFVKNFEAEHMLPPKEWPEFFMQFVEKLRVVRPVSESDTSAGFGGGITMSQFASAVPVVAAKLKARLISPAEEEKDPIDEISFLILKPNKNSINRKTVTPSTSLFRVHHQSGREQRTHFLPTKGASPEELEKTNGDMPSVLVSFPSGYFIEPSDLTEKGLCRVYFVGMGLGDDYWIDLHLLDKKKCTLIVEKPDGRRVQYALEPYEETDQSGKTVLVAGVKSLNQGWQELGATPVYWNVVADTQRELNLKHCRDLEQLYRKKIAQHPGEIPLASSLEKEDVTWQRKLVLRAASQWQNSYF